jgi:hypothetical protein
MKSRNMAQPKKRVSRKRPNDRIQRMREYLKREVWPCIPPDALGKKMTKAEPEAILGIGFKGYPE